MPGSDSARLHAVYAAKNPDEIAQLYDAWAEGYDADMARSGYRHPAVATALMARHLPAGAAPLLDAGAGTGLCGDWLGILGYPHLVALDISAGMLARARARGVYREMHRAALGGDLPFPSGRFAGVICAGVLTTGHVGPDALPGLYRVTRRGGILVLTVKESLWQRDFAAAIGAAAQAGEIALAESTAPYVSMPGDPSSTPSRAVVLRRVSAAP